MLVLFSALVVSKHTGRHRRTSVHDVEMQSNGEWTEYEYKQAAAAVKTVLFKKGKVLKEINNISDAIIHSRSGAGGDLPAGPGLYEELSHFSSYQETFAKKGKLYKHLVKQIGYLSKYTYAGYIENEWNLSYHCNSFTLGGYSWNPVYRIPFECERKDGARICKAEGDVFSSGYDVWDFERNEGMSGIYYITHELIPELLVKLHGKNMKPFNTHYNRTDHFNIHVKFT